MVKLIWNRSNDSVEEPFDNAASSLPDIVSNIKPNSTRINRCNSNQGSRPCRVPNTMSCDELSDKPSEKPEDKLSDESDTNLGEEPDTDTDNGTSNEPDENSGEMSGHEPEVDSEPLMTESGKESGAMGSDGEAAGACALAILVNGLLGFAKGELPWDSNASYWEGALDERTDRSGLTVAEVSVGPLSSQHDRACELFANIKGLRVDFGEAHSKQEGHQRWGPDFTGQGIHPNWDAQHPVHLIGHSAGGNTARTLQQLLQEDFWGIGSNGDWILSITCISSPLNGSPLCYWGACDRKHGKFSMNNFTTAIGLYAITSHEMLKLTHWGGEPSHFDSVFSLFKWLRACKIFEGNDNLAYDLTVHACKDVNAEWLRDCPNTYYFSYITQNTEPKPKGGVKSVQCSPFLSITGKLLSYKWPEKLPAPFDPKDVNWKLNDGMVPVASQRMPLLGAHAIGGAISNAIEESQLKPGIWYHQMVKDLAGTPNKFWDHFEPSIVRSEMWNIMTKPLRQRAPMKWVHRVTQYATKDNIVTKEDQRNFYAAVYRRLSRLRR